MSSLSAPDGIYLPEDMKIVANVFNRVSDEPWFISSTPEQRAEFARYVLRMYGLGMILPEPLETLCRAAAKAHFSTDAKDLSPIRGPRILIVEDEYLIAAEAAQRLHSLGAEVHGPVGTVAEAMDLVERSNEKLDAALLDINLNGQMVYPVAAFLKMHNVPFAFITGYEERVIPAFFRSVSTFTKPADWGMIASRLVHMQAPHSA